MARSDVTPVEMAKKQKSRWDFLTGLAGTKKNTLQINGPNISTLLFFMCYITVQQYSINTALKADI